MPDRYDIVIAGGGMVGASLALRLGAVLPPQMSILLVEGFALPAPAKGEAPAYHPAFDARSTALSYSSRVIYEQMNAWESLSEHACAIQSIHVSSRGRFGNALLHASDHNWPALGYVVENSWLGNTLVQQLYCRERVEVRSPMKVLSVAPERDGVVLQLEGVQAAVHAQLLVVADGAASNLREQLGVAVTEKSYRQHALVANIASATAHAGCAYERFTDEGPLALLPLVASAGGEHRSSLVWTLPPQRARQLVESSESDFLQALQTRFGYRLGRLLQVGARHEYALSLVRASEQVRQGIVVMGNAAHALHPVAGQGFNLALRDVAALGNALRDGVAQGLSPGDLTLLQHYRRRQQADQERTIGFSDRVPALFMHADPLLALGRDLGLAGLDILPALKREFVRYAAGMAGDLGLEQGREHG